MSDENELTPPAGIPYEGPIPHWKVMRINNYPDMIEYIDGVVKGDQDQIQAYIDKCNEVKAAYPKDMPEPENDGTDEVFTNSQAQE